MLSVNFHYHGHQMEQIQSKEAGETEMHTYSNNHNHIQTRAFEGNKKKIVKEGHTMSITQAKTGSQKDCKRNTQGIEQTYTP